MSKFALITDTNALNKESALLAKQIKSVDNRIQAYLVSEIAHIEIHRNPTRLNTFFETLGKRSGSRVAAMRAFVLAHANVVEEEKVKGKDKSERTIFPRFKMRKSRAPHIGDYWVKQAIETSWTEFKPETFSSTLTEDELKSAVQSLLAKAIENGYSEVAVANLIPDCVSAAKADAEKAIKRAQKKAETRKQREAERRDAIKAMRDDVLAEG